MTAEQTGFCPRCGTKRPAGSQFCEKCGFEFGEAAPAAPPRDDEPAAIDSLPPPPPPKQTGGIAGWGAKRWAIAGGGAAALVALVAVIVITLGGDEEPVLQPVTQPPVAGPAPSPSLSPGVDVAAAAERVPCFDVYEQAQVVDLSTGHDPPYAHGEEGTPAAGGNHTPIPLPAEPKVYTQQPPEESAVHNLEHGYVIIYYRPGDSPLPQEIVAALEDLVNGETEVLMAPYEGAESALWLIAWGVRQACEPAAGANPADVVLVAQAFIDEWKNGPYAPEPQAT
jgi:hypothetical protein